MSWRAKAACRGMIPQIRDRVFFPPSPKKGISPDFREAKKLCDQCPVASECLDEALDTREINDGMWGGKTPAEREALFRKRYGMARRHICWKCGYPFMTVHQQNQCDSCRLADLVRMPESWVEQISRGHARGNRRSASGAA